MKPVYVPRHKRKRLHGAFQGGFSAGYFNTVGSGEGFQPSEEVKEQKPSDFMDEQDHQDFGGPTALHQDFNNKKVVHSGIDALWKVDQVPANVGRRLLQVMIGSSKIPDEGSSRPIPEPKLDLCGLGYSPFDNAPEFQRHKEQRQKRARERAYARQDVYRIDDVLGGTSKKGVENAGHHTEGPYTSYETVEDFVGDRSAGGFALRDDQDDAFDQDTNEYDNVAYEHESDDDVVQDQKKNVKSALSAWVNTESDEKHVLTTSDGKPPLPGFTVSTSTESGVKRFPGPDLPSNYDIKPHVFRPNEHPSIFKAFSHAESLDKQQEREKVKIDRALEANKIRSVPIHNTSAFASLASSMKNRFTSESKVEESAPSLKPGLSGVEDLPKVIAQAEPSTKIQAPEKIQIIRTVSTFVPVPLMCKRFGVPAPKQTQMVAHATPASREETFFQNEVMQQAANAPKPAKMTALELVNAEHAEVPEFRPAMAIFQSIFNIKEERKRKVEKREDPLTSLVPSNESRRSPSSSSSDSDQSRHRKRRKKDDRKRRRKEKKSKKIKKKKKSKKHDS